MDTVFSHPLVTAVIAGFILVGVVGKLMKFSFERIAKWYLYVSIFSVIVVMDSIFFPFIGGKDWFFRFAVELSLISVVLWWAFEARAGEVKERIVALFKNPIVRAATVFTFFFLLACLFAVDIHAAFWSNFERGEGGFEMLHYYAFFLLLVFLLRDEKEWRTLFKASLWAAGFMILYGLGANYSFDSFVGPYSAAAVPAGWLHKLIDGRFEGSLGNPAYVDPYLIFSMFYAGYLWASAKMENRMTKVTSWGYGISIAVFLLFFILGQTRGAFLGLAVGVFVFLLYVIFSSRGNIRKWGAVILGILVILGAGLYSLRNTSFVENLPEGRLLQISFSDTTAQTRFWVWDEAWKGFLERPIFGWGPENFTAVFDKYFNPSFYAPGQNNETWFDRAHSIYFDYLSETGILGFLSYFAIFVMFFLAFRKKRHRVQPHEHSGAVIVQQGLILALPIAYLVQGAAIFDVLPMYINLFLFFAFAAYYFYNHNHGRSNV